MKHIFVTGGVVSSLGKGLTSGALGALLECHGLRVELQKFDPYLNLDPGTMSPLQHGEVYVLDDGTETDLDLGHYERFTHAILSRENSLTAGRIYESVLQKERNGDYLGQTVQVIPHITDEIKSHLRRVDTGADLCITEIGGTIGDIESLPFLEALRQFALEEGRENVLFMHLTLLLYLRSAEELKTKPTQQSVAKLREIGIQPDILVCRTEQPITPTIRQKISLFCNVPPQAVVEERDLQHSIYELPHVLHQEKLDALVLQHLQLAPRECHIEVWEKISQQIQQTKPIYHIGLIGKYISCKDAYKSIYEALAHAGIALSCSVKAVAIDSETLLSEKDCHEQLRTLDGILTPGGFGTRGIEGKILAANYAREHAIPYFGICLGMQVAAIAFARNVLQWPHANSTEFDPQTPHPIICRMAGQKDTDVKGGSMHLGAITCHLSAGTLSQKAYGKNYISERHRHRYEFNSTFEEEFQKHGMVITGRCLDNHAIEILEIPAHPWYVAVQFHPEFLSKPWQAHPLFRSFLQAASHHGHAND
ncbi:MAG: CTP synthase [Puniceicoccales bacterium]|jgi:CTP synthase|nr:CTP synthase [Puniceicoccales bacterium]